MNKEVINWLLEGPAWIRYATQLQVLSTKSYLPLTLISAKKSTMFLLLANLAILEGHTGMLAINAT